ncbi:MAG: hypothetical protein QOE27_2877 [Solirubrobacteraceae bacterium]|nr:hypothetical protein [Solirubrobacteraceae bacterium]
MPAELTVAALDLRLAELGLAADRIRENLVGLELDPDRELLDGIVLAGESAVRWAAASAEIDYLWWGLGQLDAVLERARALRGARRLRSARLAELRDLLDDRSIELSSAVPLADRVLLDGVGATQRCAPAELLIRMSDAFDAVRTAVVEIAGVGTALTPPLEVARRLVADAERRAAELGEPTRPDLVEAARGLATLGATLRTDPLAVARDQLDELKVALEAIRLDLEATAALTRDHVSRIVLARQLLSDLRSVERALAAAQAELMVKVAATETATTTTTAAGQAPVASIGALEAGLAEIAGLTDAGAWREARVVLEAWMIDARSALAEARRTLRARRAPIEARNQLRGLLDAYQVKASRLGLIENPDLVEIFAHARQELYTAPTDLPLVGDLVRRCQVALSIPATGGEA